MLIVTAGLKTGSPICIEARSRDDDIIAVSDDCEIPNNGAKVTSVIAGDLGPKKYIHTITIRGTI